MIREAVVPYEGDYPGIDHSEILGGKSACSASNFLEDIH
jgi:hypothetical protein